MFHDSFLFNAQGADKRLERAVLGRLPGPFSGLRLVVPRAMCAYQRVDGSGVPRLKLPGFARLQVQTLSPFARHGACAIRQGNWLHLWIWDAAIEAAFSEKHGGKQRFTALPHSLYSSPVASGTVWLAAPGQTGVEAQLWKDRQLIDSMWFEQAPGEADWAALHAQLPGFQALGWPLALPTSAAAPAAPRPWARNLTPRLQNRARIRWASLAPVTLVLATAALAGWGSWVYSQKESQQQAIAQGLQTQERLLAELEPLQQARQRANNTLAWINTVQQLAPGPNTHSILAELADSFTRQGLVVREMTINAPTVEATLVPLSGGSPRLTAVLGVLESHPWFYDARFVDVSGGTGFKFAWRLRDEAADTATAITSVSGNRP
jgi:hypothetical protein